MVHHFFVLETWMSPPWEPNALRKNLTNDIHDLFATHLTISSPSSCQKKKPSNFGNSTKKKSLRSQLNHKKKHLPSLKEFIHDTKAFLEMHLPPAGGTMAASVVVVQLQRELTFSSECLRVGTWLLSSGLICI